MNRIKSNRIESNRIEHKLLLNLNRVRYAAMNEVPRQEKEKKIQAKQKIEQNFNLD